MEWPNGIEDNNPTPPWIELPRDVTQNILGRLGAVEILENAQRVCTTWQSVCSDPSMWRVIDLKKVCDHVLFRRAVDLSQGQLTDITIGYYCGTDDLLHYISDRSSCLKCLGLSCCDISSEGLTTFVKKFPELEALHLNYMSWVTAKDIEVISTACPKLKSFAFGNHRSRFSPVEIDDSYALTIAKNMPSLQHLCLYGIRLSTEGLKAIFNGCPNLELLCLCQCFNFDLQGDFGKLCSERIKYMKCSAEMIDEEDWDALDPVDEDNWYDD